MHHALVVGVGTFCNKSSLILQRLVAEVDADVGHVGARDVVACPPRSLRSVSICTFVLVKCQYLYFCTSKAEEDADVGQVDAGGKREQGGGPALRGAPQR